MMLRGRTLGVIGVVVGALLLVWLYVAHRAERALEAAREAAVVAPSRVRDIGGETGVVLDSETIRRIGLAAAVVGSGRGGIEITLSGELIADPGQGATVRAPVSGRLSALPGTGWPTLGERLTGGAEIGQVSDARPLLIPRSGVVNAVYAQPGEIVEAGQPLLQITDYSRPLARVAWRSDAPLPAPGALSLSPLDQPGTRIAARLVGPAAEVDPLTRRPAFLYRAAQGWPGARPGASVLARMTDARVSRGGVIIPADAVVQWEGLAWAYVRRRPGQYVRLPVPTDRPVPGGWLAEQRWHPGDSVVVRGASLLLSEEFRARVTVGDEVVN